MTSRPSFPFLAHRTLAEVDETERLRHIRAQDPRAMWGGMGVRLHNLELRESTYNPPAATEGERA